MTIREITSAYAPRQSARVKTIAQILALDESQIRRLVAAGELEAHRIGKRGLRVYLDSVQHWQQTHAVTPRKSTRTTPVATPPRPPSPATRNALRQALADLRADDLV